MTTQPSGSHGFAISTQAFLIICRLFDSVYDDWKRQAATEQVVESIASSLLGGVQFLQAQPTPPKRVPVRLTVQQAFVLRKLILEAYNRLPDQAEQARTRAWMEEWLRELDQVQP